MVYSANRRSSHPAPAGTTPDPRAREHSRASSIFPYSTARPPTDYSSQKWVRDHPPLPSPERRSRENPFTDHEDIDTETETPLYARSDWDQPTGGISTATRTGVSRGITVRTGKSGVEGLGSEDERSPRLPSRGTSIKTLGSSLSGRAASYVDRNGGRSEEEEDRWREEPTAWTQSSWNGPITSFAETLPKESSHSPYPPSTYGGSYATTPQTAPTPARPRDRIAEGAWGGPIVDSPVPQTSAPATSRITLSAGGIDIRNQKGGTTFRSSLPSVLSLGQLANRKSRAVLRNTFQAAPTPGVPSGPPGIPPVPSSPAVVPPTLSTAAHRKLGRMSVAPARYSHAASSPLALGTPMPFAPALEDKRLGARMANTSFGRWILSYRPILNSIAALIAALLLVIALTSSNGVGAFAILHPGAFQEQRGEGKVSLGVNGWCALRSNGYHDGDFSNGAGDFRLPGNTSLLPALHNLLAGLAVATWLLALFQVVTSALQSILFFGLSLPFSHLIDAQYPLLSLLSKEDLHHAKRAVGEHQAEVDLRGRCERPPYDTWEWLWWAWWAHKRSPLVHIFAVAAGLLAVCTLGVGVAWKRQIGDAADEGPEAVEFGGSVFLPLIALVLTLDPLISAIRYWLHTSSNLNRFSSPPEPTHSAIYLPAGEKSMRHIVRSHSGSFFAHHTTVPPTTTLFDEGATRTQGGELDEETTRWLAHYPSDPDLVGLIQRIQSGEENPDFILSDVGLLYLRPEGHESALLVPPRGVIRRELVEDAHLELVESANGEEGSSGHFGPGTMLEKLSTTFWWSDMQIDVERFVKGCRFCNADEIEARERLAALEERPGMTAVPITGATDVTGWTGAPTGSRGTRAQRVAEIAGSAMAVEMAFAMRQAQDQARRDALG